MIIDALPGKGKTSYAIQKINSYPQKSFVYCTPLLSEIDRIKEATHKRFYDPTYKDGRKICGLNDLLSQCHDIAVSHSTFANATEETVELVREGQYTLILDETIDCVSEYNGVVEGFGNKMTKADIKFLIDRKAIDIDDYGRVHWICDSYIGSNYTEVERLAKRGNLILINDTLFLWEFPVDVIKAFEEVSVLTYLFEGSQLQAFFDYHDIPYVLYGVEEIPDSDKQYRLCEYVVDTKDRQKYKELINILYDEKLNNYPNGAFSSTWYKNNLGKPVMKRIKDDLYNYFRNITKAPSSNIMWTCISGAKGSGKNALSGKGYTMVKQLTNADKYARLLEIETVNLFKQLGRKPTQKEIEELEVYINKHKKKLSANETDRLRKKLSCFVPCNARASNDYRERNVLAYVVNMWPNEFINQFFKRKGFEINKDMFGLSCMLQWLFRSAVRDDKEITIWIPSMRMRDLLIAWLDGEI